MTELNRQSQELLTYSCDEVCEPDTPKAFFFFNNFTEHIYHESNAGQMTPRSMTKAASDELPPFRSYMVKVKPLDSRQMQAVIQHKDGEVDQQQYEHPCASGV